LVIPLLLLGALLQGEGPLLEASVDEDRLSIGEELIYTLRAVSHSPVAMEISVAPVLGLEIIGRSERTEISTGAQSSRTTVLEIRLRAAKPGRWQLGPAKAVQGRDTVEAAALAIEVTANRAATATGLSPRLHGLVDRAQPPVMGQPGVHLLIAPNSVRVGEQVDVVTAAWFPRELRLQLRRPPTLQPPVIDGVWSYPQSTPTGIAATRNIRGHWYDLFVAHQIVFPLVPGTINIPRATLKYSTPVAMQFFSQEERFALTSDPETLTVQPLPETGRPVTFSGAVGSGLTFERRLAVPTARVGEAIPVEFVLQGEGNTALWPAPEVSWPTAGRAYMERVDERVTGTEGKVGGTKTFRFLVVADSAGLLPLPSVSYPYFDLASSRYLTLQVAAGSVPVAPAGEAAIAAALPPSLMHAEHPSLAWQVGHRVRHGCGSPSCYCRPYSWQSEEDGRPGRALAHARRSETISAVPKRSWMRWWVSSSPIRTAALGPDSPAPCAPPAPMRNSRPELPPLGNDCSPVATAQAPGCPANPRWLTKSTSWSNDSVGPCAVGREGV
jgi:hypothetical protein